MPLLLRLPYFEQTDTLGNAPCCSTTEEELKQEFQYAAVPLPGSTRIMLCMDGQAASGYDNGIARPRI
jgi:hypothetical protein